MSEQQAPNGEQNSFSAASEMQNLSPDTLTPPELQEGKLSAKDLEETGWYVLQRTRELAHQNSKEAKDAFYSTADFLNRTNIGLFSSGIKPSSWREISGGERGKAIVGHIREMQKYAANAGKAYSERSMRNDLLDTDEIYSLDKIVSALEEVQEVANGREVGPDAFPLAEGGAMVLHEIGMLPEDSFVHDNDPFHVGNLKTAIHAVKKA